MASTEKTEQKLEILPNGIIQVRNTRVIMDNGVELSRVHHRKVIDVDDDVTNESQRIKDIAASVWTDEVKANRLIEKESNNE
jgi:hypothetical protein